MQFLLDTHALIWFLNGDNQLTKTAKEAIANVDNQCFFSIASLWEIAIKKSLGKLILMENYIEILPITLSHIQQTSTLPFFHRSI